VSLRGALAAGLLAAAAGAGAGADDGVGVRAQEIAGYTVEGDGIAQPLAGLRGDPARGRAIVASRQQGLCLLCHAAPIPEERFQGDLAPDLAGVGARYGEAQLRLRIVDPRRVNPASFMPAFHAARNAPRTGAPWTGQPVLSAQQVEDVVAWLATLR
jgi:sulfur-oxidizing protein SoxX